MSARTQHPAYRALIDKWRSCSFNRAPFIFPGDSILLEKRYKDHVRVIRNFAEYVRHKSFGIKRDKALHLGLLPQPYSGNLARARIFVLLLNPGLQPLDYYAEGKQSVRAAVIADIHQKKKGRYPFPSLDPNFSWRGGARYWRPRLDDHVRELMKRNGDYYKALAELSRSMCVLQLVPYHSRAFGLPRGIINELASVKAIKEFVHEVIIPEAHNGDALVIVARKAKQWEIHAFKNVIVYHGSESRAGYISLASRGGKAVARFLHKGRSMGK